MAEPPAQACRSTTALGARLGRVVADLRDPSFGRIRPEQPSGSRIPRGSPLLLARLWHGPIL